MQSIRTCYDAATRPVERKQQERVSTALSTEVRSLTFARSAAALVIRGRATLDEFTELRRSVLTVVAQTEVEVLVLSLGDVEAMDSAGAAILIEAIELSRKRKLKLLLCSPSPSVARMFRLAGIEDALDCCCNTPEETKVRVLAES